MLQQEDGIYGDTWNVDACRGNNNHLNGLGMGRFGHVKTDGAMGGMNPVGVNLNILAMGFSRDTQLLVAQMAQAPIAAVVSGEPSGTSNVGWLSIQQGRGPYSAGVNSMPMSQPSGARTPEGAVGHRPRGAKHRSRRAPKGEDDIDDIPTWL